MNLVEYKLYVHHCAWLGDGLVLLNGDDDDDDDGREEEEEGEKEEKGERHVYHDIVPEKWVEELEVI